MKYTFVEDSAIFIKSVQGIDYVRPPTLDFLKIKDTDDYVEYKIITKKNAKKKAEPKKGCPENPFTNYLDSFISVMILSISRYPKIHI